MTPIERLEKYIRARYDTNESFDNLVAALKEEERKSSTQDPATINNTTVDSIHKTDREIGDIDFMYKWIREKSGK